MPNFTYKARSALGEQVSGVIAANNCEEAVQTLIQQGYTPIEVTAEDTQEKKSPEKHSHSFFHFFHRIKSAEVNLFTRHLCDLVAAGVPLLRAFKILVDQTQNPHFKKIIAGMCSFIQNGGTLSDALAEHPQIFSKLYINMVKAGEVSGDLETVLSRLAEFSEKDQATRSKLILSLLYPMLVIVLGGGIVVVLLTFVIPRLTVMFDDLGAALPLPTVILINMSDFLAHFWWVILIILMLGLLYFKRMHESQEGRIWFDSFKMKVPFMGNFIRDVEISRFSRTLGTLLDNGVTIISALDTVWGVMDNEIFKKEITKVCEDVTNGSSLTMALKEGHFLPSMALSIIAVGEEAGRLEKGLYKLADSYERQAEEMSQKMVSLLGPIALIIVVMIVGFIVLAMLLPIFQTNLIIQ